jgi:hypothetical protein
MSCFVLSRVASSARSTRLRGRDIGIKYVGNGRDEDLVDHGHVKIHSHHVTEL